MDKPRTSSRAGTQPEADLPWDPGFGPAGGAAPPRALERDPSSLRVQIDALLLDPRGHFRPFPLMLRPSDGSDALDDLLVMQVGEHGDGCIGVVTPEPLVPGACFRVQPAQEPDFGQAAPPGGLYLVTGCRPGHRPEDAGQACWISTLCPEPESLPAHCGHPPDGA